MICDTCRFSGRPGWIWTVSAGCFGYREVFAACPDCIGGIASCCDGAGSQQPEPKRLAPPSPYSPGEGIGYRPMGTTVYENPEWEPVEYDFFIPFAPTTSE